MSKFAEVVGNFGRSLTSQYETIFEHSGNVGDSREKAVIDFLRKVCPNQFGFSKGEFFDSESATSGEVDIIIYDQVFSTTFSDGSGKILAPIESCFGAIECKSTLTIGELDDALRKIKRYRQMKRPRPGPKQAYILPHFAIAAGVGLNVVGTKNEPVFGVFAYQNKIALQTLLTTLANADAPDFVVVPKKFVFINGRRSSDQKNTIIESEDSVAIWTMLLQIILKNTHLISADTQQMLKQLTVGVPTWQLG